MGRGNTQTLRGARIDEPIGRGDTQRMEQRRAPRNEHLAGEVARKKMAGASRIDAVRHGATFSRLVAGLCLGMGSAVLIGWLADVHALKSILPGLATMKANTAVAFILSGLALWCLSKPSIPNELRTRTGRASATVVLLIAVMTLAEYAFGWNLGVDQLLIHDPSGPIGATHPGQ